MAQVNEVETIWGATANFVNGLTDEKAATALVRAAAKTTAKLAIEAKTTKRENAKFELKRQAFLAQQQKKTAIIV